VAQAPDLFVVCSSCQNEVSPYITECPYCGTRLRKRAPKIQRDGTVEEPGRGTGRPRGAVAKPPKPPKQKRARRLRPVRPAPSPYDTQRPWGTLLLVGLSLFGGLLLSVIDRRDAALAGPVDGEWWRIASTVFLYPGLWYELAVVGAIGLFGWLLERRHGAAVPLALFVVCGMGGAALAAVLEPSPLALGANGAALGLLCAWAVPDLRRARRAEEHDADLIGVATFAAVLLLLPLVVLEANPIAGVAGGLAGLLAGLALGSRE
jgi:membrane associated rhomboid family serine protease